MGIIDTLKNALKATASGPVEAALDKARQEETEAGAALQALVDRRSQALLAGDDALRRFKAEQAQAEERLERASAFVAALEAQLTDVREREAESAAAAKYRAAKKLSDAAASRLAEIYPRAARELADLVRQCAEADLAVQEANQNLPAGKGALQGPESLLRDLPPEEARVLKRRRVKRWTFESSGHLIPTEREAEIQSISGDNAVIQHGGLTPGSSKVVRRVFEEQTVVPARRRERGPRLAELFLPALRAGEPPFWSPGHETSYPESILRRVSELAGLKPRLRPEDQPEILLIPIEDQDEPDAEPEPEAA